VTNVLQDSSLVNGLVCQRGSGVVSLETSPHATVVRGERGRLRCPVLPPGRSADLLCLRRPLGLGCVGDLRLLAWRCRLGPLWGMYPGGACLVEAASLMWNKVLVPIHFAISCSEDGDGLLRWRSSGSAAPNFGDLCVGAFGRLSVVMVFTALRGEARGEAAMSAVVWYVDLAPSSPGLWWVGRWVAQIRARVCMGCVPGRCLLGFFFPFVAGCYCGSSQSH
jgi:hypothetical protein